MNCFNSCIIFILLLLSGFISSSSSFAQEAPADTVTKTKIYLEHADVRSFNKKIDDQRQILMGNVVFRHDSSFMYCDSAYFYERDLSLEAFGLVRLEQGDTLFVYGDYLFYDGNIELARMRRNVRMVNIQPDSSEVTLYTDSLDYNRRTDLCYYFDGGRVIDAENELTSVYGQYSPGTKIAVFNDSVCLTNPNFVLHSDTLEYSTDTKIATILGPSVIESDSGVIHSSRGWYNTENNTSLLLDRSHVLSGEKSLVGDSLIYDKAAGIGKAFGNMNLRDSAQQMTLTGHYGYYEESTEYAFATDSACALEYSQGDTLFLHADTLELITIDSASRILRAVHGVRFYRSDIQGICDSMRFNTKDSALYMYGTPVLWNENQQLFGDSIIIYMADSTVDYVHVPTSAFSVQSVDSAHFNQLGGNDLKAYFSGKHPEHVDIDGNAESIYYPLEKDGTIEMLNYTKSSYLSFWMDEEGRFRKLKLYPPNPVGKTTPIPDLSDEERTLKKFAWYGDLRPVDKNDIFRFYEKKEPPIAVRDSSFISDTLRLPEDTAALLRRIEPEDSLRWIPSAADTITGSEEEHVCKDATPPDAFSEPGAGGGLFRAANPAVNRQTVASGKPDFFRRRRTFTEQKNRRIRT
jgi:lipopolysaccharide export system protein LptA